MSGDNSGKGKFASLLLLFQGILLILFVVFVDYGPELMPSDSGPANANAVQSANSNIAGKILIQIKEFSGLFYLTVKF